MKGPFTKADIAQNPKAHLRLLTSEALSQRTASAGSLPPSSYPGSPRASCCEKHVLPGMGFHVRLGASSYRSIWGLVKGAHDKASKTQHVTIWKRYTDPNYTMTIAPEIAPDEFTGIFTTSYRAHN